MFETYYDSAEDITITRERAIKEFLDHGLTEDDPEFKDFLEFLGDRQELDAQEVLRELGY